VRMENYTPAQKADHAYSLVHRKQALKILFNRHLTTKSWIVDHFHFPAIKYQCQFW
jgi:hypothetical protein